MGFIHLRFNSLMVRGLFAQAPLCLCASNSQLIAVMVALVGDTDNAFAVAEKLASVRAVRTWQSGRFSSSPWVLAVFCVFTSHDKCREVGFCWRRLGHYFLEPFLSGRYFLYLCCLGGTGNLDSMRVDFRKSFCILCKFPEPFGTFHCLFFVKEDLGS